MQPNEDRAAFKGACVSWWALRHLAIVAASNPSSGPLFGVSCVSVARSTDPCNAGDGTCMSGSLEGTQEIQGMMSKLSLPPVILIPCTRLHHKPPLHLYILTQLFSWCGIPHHRMNKWLIVTVLSKYNFYNYMNQHCAKPFKNSKSVQVFIAPYCFLDHLKGLTDNHLHRLESLPPTYWAVLYFKMQTYLLSQQFDTGSLAENSTACPANATICKGTSCVLPEDNFNETLSVILSTVLTIMLALVMFSMGCNVEVKKFWGHIKKPWGIFVGFLCQFGIMPLTAFLLSLVFNVLPIQAVVVLIMGCCPGGTASNVIAYWVDGDMDLR